MFSLTINRRISKNGHYLAPLWIDVGGIESITQSSEVYPIHHDLIQACASIKMLCSFEILDLATKQQSENF